VADGSLMGRWFRARGGDIGAGVDAVDNGDSLIEPFIGPLGGGRRAVKWRELASVEFQWCQLREMEMGKGRRWGAAIFGGGEGQEARWLHGARGG
jgi:hypothetical protein